MSGLQICEAPLKSPGLLRPGRAGAWLLAPVCLLGIASAAPQSDHRAKLDRGAVPADFALHGMTLTVRRTPAQQSDLDRLLAAQHKRSGQAPAMAGEPGFQDPSGGPRPYLRVCPLQVQSRIGWRPRADL